MTSTNGTWLDSDADSRVEPSPLPESSVLARNSYLGYGDSWGKPSPLPEPSAPPRSSYLGFRNNWAKGRRSVQSDKRRMSAGEGQDDNRGGSLQWLNSGRGVAAPPAASGTGSETGTGGEKRNRSDRETKPRRTSTPSHGNRRDLHELPAPVSATRTRQPHVWSQALRQGRDSDISALEDQDLTELTAPAPARQDKPTQPLPKNYRPRRESVNEEEQDDLNELEAPSPVQSETADGGWQREDRLEDAPAYDEEDEKKREKGGGGQSDLSPIATQVYIVSYLILFSVLGTLARLGVQWLTFYPGAPNIFSNIWANFGGTLIMGFLAEDQKLFQEEWGGDRASSDPRTYKDEHPRGTPEKREAHLKTKKTIPLYIGLTIGFCGSFTSFSSFERDVFLALANLMPTPLNHPIDVNTTPDSTAPRNGGYSFEAVMAVILLTITASLCALQFGAHAAIALDRFTPALPFHFVRRIFDPVIVFLGAFCWLGAIIMAAVPPDRPGGPAYNGGPETWRGQVLFALVFAPLGCLLRFYLSLKLNGRIPWFPLGTFIANVFGTAVLGMAYDLQRVPLSASNMLTGGGRIGCQVLQGVQDGFCGCLTTVSTWVVELTSLRRRHAYIYGLSSVAIGLGMLIVIMGSVTWSIGFKQPACAFEVS